MSQFLIIHYHKQIDNLKFKLASLDYKTDKFIEGEITAEEFEEVKKQRKIWRTEINQLEAKIAELQK